MLLQLEPFGAEINDRAFGNAGARVKILEAADADSAIAFRSSVMPCFVTLPFIQCHHVCGFADAGGVMKSDSTCWLAARRVVVELPERRDHRGGGSEAGGF